MKRYFIIPDLDDRVYVLENIGGEWTGVAYFNNGAAGVKTWTLEALQNKWAREITREQAFKLTSFVGEFES